MIKCINFELSKRLNDLGLLDNIETKYYISEIGENILYSNKEAKDLRLNFNAGYIGMFKTLTLEEAIEFLPIQINNYYFIFGKNDNGYWCNYLEKDKDELYILNSSLFINICNKNTLLEAIENMLEFLFY